MISFSEAQKAFEDHANPVHGSCDVCARASSGRTACAEGKRLHEEMVRAAHEEHKGG